MARSIGQLLAGGGVAQQTWDNQNRQYRDDAFTEEARRIAMERAKADNLLIPDRTAAERARLGVATDTANAQRGHIPQATANRSKALALEGRGLDEQDATFGTQAATNRDVLAANRNKASLQLKESGLAVEQWPSAAKRARVQGLIDDQKAGMWGLAGLHYAMLSGNSKQLLTYINEAAKQGLMPGMDGAEFVSAELLRDATDQSGAKVGDVLAFKTKDGRQVNFSKTAIENAYNTVSPREIHKVGERLVSVGASGDVRQLVGQPDKWKIEDGIAINEADGTRIKVAGGRSKEQVTNDIKRGREHLDTVYGIKRDAMGNMLNPDVIQDNDAWLRDDAELQRRVIEGEDPVKAGSEIGRRAISGKRADEVAPKAKSPAADQILKDHGWED